jgi:hypothetical protein
MAITLYNAVVARRWNKVFSGNQSHLNIVGFDKLQSGVSIDRLEHGDDISNYT